MAKKFIKSYIWSSTGIDTLHVMPDNKYLVIARTRNQNHTVDGDNYAQVELMVKGNRVTIQFPFEKKIHSFKILRTEQEYQKERLLTNGDFDKDSNKLPLKAFKTHRIYTGR